MNREDKRGLVTELQERLQRAQMAVLASPQGLTVGELSELRRDLRRAGGEFKVAKNTLARRAVAATPFAALGSLLQGQNGLVFGYEDPVAVAKALIKFAEGHARLKVRGGVLDGGTVTALEVTALAKLPSHEVVLGQLLGLLQAPATQLLRTIQEPAARLVRLLERARSAGGD